MISLVHGFVFSLHGKSGLAGELTTLLSKAAAATLDLKPGGVTTRIKPDGSPVTAADDAAQRFIVEGLARLLPGVPVISEELDRGPL